MYKNMLVPLDGSRLAEEVFVYAKELAAKLDLELVLLHVCKPGQEEFIPMHLAYLDRASELMMYQANELRGSEGLQQQRLQGQSKCEVVVGYPAEEIIHYAEENNIDIILVATHGRTGIKRWALGSVADKVLRASKVPIWLARAGVPQEIGYDKWPSKTILVPLDGSPLAEQILPHVEMLAKQRGTQLVEVMLIRVCEDPFVTADYPEASMPDTWQEHVKTMKAKLNEECFNYMRNVEKHLADAGVKVQSDIIMGGNPASEIIAYAKNKPFNLIAMCTHGRSGINRLVHGSVAEKLLHEVPSPIFLVRPQ